jgi:hypothetical protein
LKRFPIIDIGNQQFVAVDPDLIMQRVSLGLFYDLFEKHGTSFSTSFGFVFDEFVGTLLSQVCKSSSLWSELECKQRLRTNRKPPSKNADRAVLTHSKIILFECKSMRISLRQATYGFDTDVGELTNRIAGAVRQMSEHAISIKKGEWSTLGLGPTDCFGIIVTYGEVFTANSPFMRDRIAETLKLNGIVPLPWIVLSLVDLDALVSLMEMGIRIEDFVDTFKEEKDFFGPLARYKDELRKNGTSSFAKLKASEILDNIIERNK